MRTDTFPTDTGDAHIPDNLRELVEDELLDGEAILWIDQPIPNFFRSGASSIFFFAIPWTAFAVFWMWGAAGGVDLLNGKPIEFEVGRLVFAAFGIPFVLVGLGMLSVPLWERRKMKRTVYVVTDHRVIIVQGAFFSLNISSHFLPGIVSLSRNQRPNGTGDLCLRVGIPSDENCSSTEQRFWNIRNVKHVERMIQELKNTKTAE